MSDQTDSPQPMSDEELRASRSALQAEATAVLADLQPRGLFEVVAFEYRDGRGPSPCTGTTRNGGWT